MTASLAWCEYEAILMQLASLSMLDGTLPTQLSFLCSKQYQPFESNQIHQEMLF
jgi:hypothetical protein